MTGEEKLIPIQIPFQVNYYLETSTIINSHNTENVYLVIT